MTVIRIPRNRSVNTATLNYNNKPFIPSINRTGGGQLSIYTCTPSYENFEKTLPKTKYMYTNLANSMKVVNFMFLFSKSYSLTPPPPFFTIPFKILKITDIHILHIKYMACSHSLYITEIGPGESVDLSGTIFTK